MDPPTSPDRERSPEAVQDESNPKEINDPPTSPDRKGSPEAVQDESNPKEINRRQFWTEFLDLYRTHECLWDIKSLHFSDRDKRHVAYKSLTDKLREVNETANIDKVKRKLCNMKSAFRKEVKKLYDSKKNCAKVYVPQLWYYNKLIFLQDQEMARLYSSKVDEEPEIQKDDDSLVGSTPNTPAQQHAIIPKPTMQTKRLREEDEKDHARGTAPVHEDEFDYFGKTVAAKLRRMNPEIELIAEKLLQEVLYEGMTGKLQPTTKLTSSKQGS